AAGGFWKRLLTIPAVLGDDRYHLVHLLDRQQRAVHAAMARLAATLPSRGRSLRARRRLGWIRRRRTRGIGRGLPLPGFQLADALAQRGGLRPQGPVLEAQRGVLQAKRRQLLQQGS